MSKLLFFLSLFFVLQGCGFSSGLYQDILKAQDYITNQKFEEAVEVYEALLLKKPSKTIRIKVNYQLGEIYSIYLGDYKKSIFYFNQIIRNSNQPNWQVKSMEKIAQIYFENLKDYDKAQFYYNKLIGFIPELQNKDFYLYQTALSSFYQNKFRDSIKQFEKIISTQNNNNKIRSYYYIGMSYYYLQDWNNAINSWKEYLKREQRKDRIVKTKFMIANAYESSEKLKEAYNVYYEILGEYPNPEIIKSRLESLYNRRVARKR